MNCFKEIYDFVCSLLMIPPPEYSSDGSTDGLDDYSSYPSSDSSSLSYSTSSSDRDDEPDEYYYYDGEEFQVL